MNIFNHTETTALKLTWVKDISIIMPKTFKGNLGWVWSLDQYDPSNGV